MDNHAESASNIEFEASVSTVNATSLRLPTFWPEKPVLWFSQIETQFLLGRITKDETKFAHVIGQLSGKYAEEVEDIICHPPAENKYGKLKEELIKRLSDSDSTRVRKLLESEEIGDRTPTQFWRHLKKLAGSSVSDEFLTQMWKSRLPVKTQLVLAATSDKEGIKLAEIADRVHDIPPEKGRIAMCSQSSSRTSEMSELREQMRQLQLQISAIAQDVRKPRARSRSREKGQFRGRRNSRSRDRSATNYLCWYHYNFAEKATKCKTPCTWQSGNK